MWSVKSGQLPAGITLSSSGLISGTPTTVGDSTFVVQVTDVNRTDTETYTLSVVQQLKITAPASAAGEVGVPFSLGTRSRPAGGPRTTWSVEGTLPTGLSLNAATGDITGTPTAAGAHPVKLRVTDSLGLTDTLDVPLAVAAKLAVVKKPLPAAKVGRAFRAKLAARGGVGPLKWNILGGTPGLPPGRDQVQRQDRCVLRNADEGRRLPPADAGRRQARRQVRDRDHPEGERVTLDRTSQSASV